MDLLPLRLHCVLALTEELEPHHHADGETKELTSRRHEGTFIWSKGDEGDDVETTRDGYRLMMKDMTAMMVIICQR